MAERGGEASTLLLLLRGLLLLGLTWMGEGAKGRRVLLLLVVLGGGTR